jgi:hypothetical protein
MFLQVPQFILYHQGDHLLHFISGLPSKGFPGFPGIAPADGNFRGPEEVRVDDHMLAPIQIDLSKGRVYKFF